MYAGDKAALEQAGTYTQAADAKIAAINDIFAARAADPSLEPKFLDSRELDQFLSGTNLLESSYRTQA